MAKQEGSDYDLYIPQTSIMSLPCSVYQGYIARAKHMFNIFVRRPEARGNCAGEGQQQYS
jgi:hypothetical protein